jgi:pilus assembly protein CpaB
MTALRRRSVFWEVKRMKPARLVVLGVAIVAGGIAAWLASKSHKPEAPQPVVAQLETVQVLIAKTDLDRGQVIGPSDIGWETWPKAAANANFILQSTRPNAMGQFVGAIVRVPVAAGQPIYDPMVVFAKGSGFMAAILPKGMRAVSMNVSPDTAAGGFILPEDHVDVVLTRHDKQAEKENAGTEKILSETILRNVPVLAVDQAVEEKSGVKVAVAKTVTLEVTPGQAEQLQLARVQGSLSLSLRSLLDSGSPTPEGGVEAEANTQISTVRFGVSTNTTVNR